MSESMLFFLYIVKGQTNHHSMRKGRKIKKVEQEEKRDFKCIKWE